MSSPELIQRTEAAKRAVLAHVDLLQREFGRAESQWKADGTRVTAVDIAISEGIFRLLQAEFPGDQFFSEELTNCDAPIPVTARFSWVLDPVDGTNNFALGIPHCAIALALCEHGEPVYGVVYDLSRRTLMHGGPGFGVHDGDRPARLKAAPQTKETLIAFHSPFDKSLTPLASGIIGQFKIRGLGSATLHLAYVAVGLLDGCVDYNVKIWDLAAAIPLVRAGGGEVRFLNGGQLPMQQFDLRMGRIIYVAGTPAMCDRLQELMGEIPARFFGRK
ncbi:MAG TPA: inositol monophosphatase [Opitutaceae bacterium]|nr:inositol monophosphatase [Opitutaceae bacterium]